MMRGTHLIPRPARLPAGNGRSWSGFPAVGRVGLPPEGCGSAILLQTRMRGFEVSELRDKPVIRWIESTPVDRALILTGKTLVYFGIVSGLYVLLAMSMPRAGFFGIGARGAGITLDGLLLAGYIVLSHAALGFVCQGIGRGIQVLEAIGPDRPESAQHGKTKD